MDVLEFHICSDEIVKPEEPACEDKAEKAYCESIKEKFACSSEQERCKKTCGYCGWEPIPNWGWDWE